MGQAPRNPLKPAAGRRRSAVMCFVSA